MRPHAVPRILVSRCIEHDHCRYDGAMISDPFVRKLPGFAEIRTVCPEVEIGLGVPRKPIRLVSDGPDAVRLVQPATGRDVTGEMEAFCARLTGGLDDIDGAVLKFRSPSCGISDVRVYTGADSRASVRRGPGLFGAAVIDALGGRPVIHEGRLRNLALREHFLTSVFTLARLGAVCSECASSRSLGSLVSFHASAKLLLSAAHREEGRRLGRLVAGGGAPGEVLPAYRAGLVRALARPLRTGPCVDALMHAFGHFKKLLGPSEKALFLDSLEDFGSGRATMSPCRSMLRAWTARFENAYLDDQILFDPFPSALSSLEDSAAGRRED